MTTEHKHRLQELGIYVSISAFLAFIDPYNASGGLTYPLAFLYWLALVVCGGVSAEYAMRLYSQMFPEGSIIMRLLIGANVAAVCVSIFILAITQVLHGVSLGTTDWPVLYGLVLVISLAITSVGYLFDRAFGKISPPPVLADQANASQAFLKRLPIRFHKADLYALSSEDHYLRIHTSLGEELILMRLADAVRELAGADGLQVHRSWWVARSGIADETRENGRSFLILESGTRVPVSRSYQAAARTAGLLA
ncbi:MAG: LytTR family transcriptional regulator [Alphaproteobacteria bacterium]|nr:LytTR family transcriptional regulator [Alphaproteobacteria bacterium]